MRGVVAIAFIVAIGCAGTWWLRRMSQQRKQSANALAEMIKQRPVQCAAAIDALLNRIAPPISDPEEVGRRGQSLAQLALSTAQTMQSAGIQTPYAPFAPETASATADAVLRLIDVEREARRARIDAAIAAGNPPEDPDAPFFAAQITRLALEEPRREFFVHPDAYSGARWAKAVSTNGRLEYFLAGMRALDPSGKLAEDFAGLLEVLSATGHRLPVTAAEHASYAALKQA
jgi:hypothetical protein